MQILPTMLLDTAPVQAQVSGRDAHGFSRLLARVMDENPAEVTPTLAVDAEGRAQLQDSNPHAVGTESDPFASQAPYLQTATHLNPRFVSEEIRFTAAEVRKIAAGLQSAEFDPAVVNAVLDLAENPSGVTTPDILKAILKTIRSPAQLTDSDLDAISAFVSRMNTDGTLADAVMADILAGRTTQAWQRIVSALHAMDPETQLDVSIEEVVALGKGLGLSEDTLAALVSNFGDAQTLRSTPAQIAQLMTPAQSEVGDRQKKLEQLADSFEKIVSPVAQEARMRLAAENSANERSHRRVDQSKILIQDTVTRKGITREDEGQEEHTRLAGQKQSDKGRRDNDEPTVADKTRKAAREELQARQHGKSAPDGRVENADESRDSRQVHAFDDRQARPRSAPPEEARQTQPRQLLTGEPRQTAVTASVANQATQQETPSGTRDQASPGDRDADKRETTFALRQDAFKPEARTGGSGEAWNSLLNKVSYQTESMGLPVSQLLSGSSGQLSAQPAQAAPLPNYAPQVLKQVEQGILSGVKDGAQRLELQLTPETLGAMTVVLTTKNGEISALLRPERPETATLMNQQTDQIRFALEQQGLKVDKVEVQTQLEDHRSNMTWQGMDQHNASREQQARAQDQHRILRLGRLHRGSADLGLDRNVHDVLHGSAVTANVAGPGLHIIT